MCMTANILCTGHVIVCHQFTCNKKSNIFKVSVLLIGFNGVSVTFLVNVCPGIAGH